MPEHEVFQEQTLEVTRLADDDLPPSSEKKKSNVGILLDIIKVRSSKLSMVITLLGD